MFHVGLNPALRKVAVRSPARVSPATKLSRGQLAPLAKDGAAVDDELKR